MQPSRQKSGHLGPRSCFVAALVILVGLDGCSSHKPHAAATAPHRAIFSPNGELLSGGPLGHPSCAVAYGQWFDRLDSQKAGVMTRDVFIADAEAQFKKMDIDHDGYITAAELTKYRAAFDFDPSLGFAVERKDPSAPEEKREKNRDPNAPDWAVTRWTPDSADPVMSADRSLKFKVSHDDFMAQAEEIFGKLAGKQDHTVHRDALLAVCPSDKPVDHSWF